MAGKPLYKPHDYTLSETVQKPDRAEPLFANGKKSLIMAERDNREWWPAKV